MFCPKCGSKVEDGQRYCAKCGNPLLLRAEHEFATLPKSTKPRGLFIAIGVLSAVLLVGFAALGLLYHFDFSKISSHSNGEYLSSYNAVNGSFVARDANETYYWTDTGLVMHLDAEGKREAVLKDSTSSSFYFYNSTLYYLSNKDHTIYAADSHGENAHAICAGSIGWFTITSDYIYYINGYYDYDEETWERHETGDFGLYRVDFEGNNRSRLTYCNTQNVSFDGDSIIYCDNDTGSINALNLADGSTRTLYSYGEDYIESPIAYEGKVYYGRPDFENDSISGIYAIDLETGSSEKIITTYPSYYTFWNGKIIYTADSNSSSARTVELDMQTGESEDLLEDAISDPLVFGDELYYTDYVDGRDVICRLDLSNYESEVLEGAVYKDITISGDNLYFIDVRNGNIYRSNIDGKEIERIVDAECDDLYLYNGSIFYEGYANGYTSRTLPEDFDVFPYGFIKLDASGGNAKLVSDSVRGGALFDGEYVYYSSVWDDHIYRDSINEVYRGEDTAPFLWASDGESYELPLVFYDGWLYVLNNGESAGGNEVMRIELSSGRKESLVSGYVNDMTVYNDKMYYLSWEGGVTSGIRRMNPDGSSDMLVLDTPVSSFVIDNDVLYYTDAVYHYLYKVNLDGTNKTLLKDVDCGEFCISGGRLYYTDLYDHGSIYSDNLDGSDAKCLIGPQFSFNDQSTYITEGIDDYSESHQETRVATYDASDVLAFDDAEFERFLCTMFGKDRGTITGSDLLSIRFIGYYEGEPTEISNLENLGVNSGLYENCVFFSTMEMNDNVDATSIMFDDSAGGDTLTYRTGCSVMTVISNEWMAAHVMPNLYYFRNLQQVVFGYCWVSDDLCLPDGADQASINTHSRYLHQQYDFNDYTS